MPTRAEPSELGYWSDSVLTLVHQEAISPLRGPARAPADVEGLLRKLAFPEGVPSEANRSDSGALARHVVIVALETAPRKYYPITSSEDLPAFHRMSQQAIVSDLHYAAAPVTAHSIYSIVSGTYPPHGAMPSRFGEFRTDGLATILGTHGYETTYVDSYTIEWAERGYERSLRGLGFTRLFESPDAADTGSYYERSLVREQRSFDRALQSILEASERGKKAFVCIATSLGHYRWRAPPEEEGAPADRKLSRIVHALDGQFGRFLDSLEAHGLGNDVLIVVTGDHGLRAKSEFDSLGEHFPDSDLTYNVPLLLYAPGMLSKQRKLECPTSHVDIAPTLFDLLGIARGSLLLHGEDVLDPELCSRAIFLTGAGLYPVDSMRWLGLVFKRNRMTGRAWIDDDSVPSIWESEVARRIDEADDLFNATAGIFLHRATDLGSG